MFTFHLILSSNVDGVHYTLLMHIDYLKAYTALLKSINPHFAYGWSFHHFLQFSSINSVMKWWFFIKTVNFFYDWIIQFWYLSILFSFNKLLLQKEELEQKHLHLLQIIESEKTAKWQYTQQCEDLASEIKKLRAEVRFMSKN